MTAVKFGRLNKGKGKTPTSSIGKRMTVDEEGKRQTVRSADISSKTFGEDLKYIFGRSVDRARRENKEKTGAADVKGKRKG